MSDPVWACLMLLLSCCSASVLKHLGGTHSGRTLLHEPAERTKWRTLRFDFIFVLVERVVEKWCIADVHDPSKLVEASELE